MSLCSASALLETTSSERVSAKKRESDISNIFKVLDANNSYTIAESLPEVSHKSSLVYSKRVHSK